MPSEEIHWALDQVFSIPDILEYEGFHIKKKGELPESSNGGKPAPGLALLMGFIEHYNPKHGLSRPRITGAADIYHAHKYSDNNLHNAKPYAWAVDFTIMNPTYKNRKKQIQVLQKAKQEMFPTLTWIDAYGSDIGTAGHFHVQINDETLNTVVWSKLNTKYAILWLEQYKKKQEMACEAENEIIESQMNQEASVNEINLIYDPDKIVDAYKIQESIHSSETVDEFLDNFDVESVQKVLEYLNEKFVSLNAEHIDLAQKEHKTKDDYISIDRITNRLEVLQNEIEWLTKALNLYEKHMKERTELMGPDPETFLPY